jgi:plasmid stability protein
MAVFILRKFSDDLWARVKVRAEADGLSLRALVLAMLRGYAEGEIHVRGQQD